jgi:hypothetical protein
MALCINWREENPPVSPFFKGGSSAQTHIPLFEKEGSGEILSEKAND